MELIDTAKYDFPNVPGVYVFKRGRTVLYVGKATNLRDRVRSYFDNDLIATRGPRIVDMVVRASAVAFEPTPTVLEALVREAALIKKYKPKANVEGKDDKTFLYAVVTDEMLPRVRVVRGKDIDFKKKIAEGTRIKAWYGPFPSGTQLREALRLMRKIFPFFDTEKRVEAKSKHHRAKVEFNIQIKQYPREVNTKEYQRTIRRVMLFLAGRTKELRASLERDMRASAREERFEDAYARRRELFALEHIQDVSLIKGEDSPSTSSGQFELARIEAYDTAHLSGTNAIGVMAVLEGGMPQKSAYRTFRIRGIKKNDDVASLKEILIRRLGHLEWPLPSVIVVDGGKMQKKTAEEVLKGSGLTIPVVAVVKDERHRPREIIGSRGSGISESIAVLVNSEAHRFSLSRHRRARSRNLRTL
jgi:excinuclease ABC subunit C